MEVIIRYVDGEDQVLSESTVDSLSNLSQLLLAALIAVSTVT